MAKPSLGVSAPASDKSLVDHIKVKARDMIQRITGGGRFAAVERWKYS